MISEHTKAVLLFTSLFSKEVKGDLKPLNTMEWNMLVSWMVSSKLKPEDLLSQPGHLDSWVSAGIPRSRLLALLERRSSLAIALEKWVKAGIWIISRSEEAYPRKIREKLKNGAPPVLFGIGDQKLLHIDAVGMVGSREASEPECSYAAMLGGQIAGQSFNLVSGGAAGIDEASVQGALEAQGSALVILPDSLLKRSLEARYRRAIMAGRLVLLSPFNPEAMFSTGNAMYRNRLIYSFSVLAIVVRSGLKGGTWSGAMENLNHGWCPLYVAPLPGNNPGNMGLLKAGAGLLRATFRVQELLDQPPVITTGLDLFS